MLIVRDVNITNPFMWKSHIKLNKTAGHLPFIWPVKGSHMKFLQEITQKTKTLIDVFSVDGHVVGDFNMYKTNIENNKSF